MQPRPRNQAHDNFLKAAALAVAVLTVQNRGLCASCEGVIYVAISG